MDEKYELLKHLGPGNFGQAKLAEDKWTHEPVVVKREREREREIKRHHKRHPVIGLLKGDF